MEATQIIVKPLVTEKTNHLVETRNVYAFEVHPQANKQQIRSAVESLYDVKVVDVRTMIRKGKPRRNRYGITHTSTWKRAIVQLDENSKIDVY